MEQKLIATGIEFSTSFSFIKDAFEKSFLSGSLIRNADLTPYFNWNVRFSIFEGKKKYTFVFFPFKVKRYSGFVNPDGTCFFDAFEVYAYEDNDNINIQFDFFDFANVDSHALAQFCVYTDKDKLPLNFSTFYQKFPTKPLRILLDFLPILYNVVTDRSDSMAEFVKFIMRMTYSACEKCGLVKNSVV